MGSLPRGLQWVHWWPHIPAEQKLPRGEGASALEVSDGLRHVQWTCHSGTRGAHGGTFPHTVAPSRDRLRVMVAASGARQGQWEAAGHCEPGLHAQRADEQSAASCGAASARRPPAWERNRHCHRRSGKLPDPAKETLYRWTLVSAELSAEGRTRSQRYWAAAAQASGSSPVGAS